MGLVLAGVTQLWLLAAATLFMFVCLGMILAPAFLTAVEPFTATAGSAAALGVALELVMSSAATALLGVMADGTAWPMALLMGVSGCAALAGAVAMRTER